MVNSSLYSTNILDSLGVISSFNIAETIWEKYEKFAISKIKESTVKLRGSLYYIKDLKPKQATFEADAISSLIPVLAKLKLLIEAIENKEFKEFKIVALDFFETVDLVYTNLRDIADINGSFIVSKPVLAIDWDTDKDEHWDNY